MTDDTDPTLIFLAEAQELQASIERNLLDLGEAPGDHALIDALFRELHTLKGSSAMFGFTALSQFVHEFETAFEVLRRPGGRATNALITVALAASDHFLRLLADPGGAEADSAALLARLQAALDAPDSAATAPAGNAAAGNRSSGSAQAATAPTHDPTADRMAGGRDWVIRLALQPDTLSLGIHPYRLIDELLGLAAGAGKSDPALPPDPADAPLDGLEPGRAWTVTLPGHVSREAIDDVFVFAADFLDLSVAGPGAPGAEAGGTVAQRSDPGSGAQTGPAPGPDPDSAAAPAPVHRTGPTVTAPPEGARTRDRAAAASAAPAPAPGGRAAPNGPTTPPAARAAASPTMRVATARLDEMMDRVGELVIAEARLREISTALGDAALLNVAEDLHRLTAGMRDTTMTIRMVPIGSLFGRFRRLVHDLSEQLGKPIDMATLGGETELDKTVIEQLGDPLVHILRNAMDHGIEPAAARAAAGKPAGGRIEIRAEQAGAEVLIRIADDGAGLDLDRIRARAVARGLIAEGQPISDAELRAMILEPGFSTAETVTNLSGRGVGMDVVRSTMENLRGGIEVDSIAGQGTTVTLRLPLTLAIIDGLLVEIGGERYTVPLAAIEECVELPQAQAAADGRSHFLSVRDGLVPFLRLAGLFDVPGPRADWQQVVIVGSALGRVGLVVDRIIGTNQTVIKQLGRLHQGLKSFSGATILGDGSVSLIFDVANLVALGRALEAEARVHERVA